MGAIGRREVRSLLGKGRQGELQDGTGAERQSSAETLHGRPEQREIGRARHLQQIVDQLHHYIEGGFTVMKIV